MTVPLVAARAGVTPFTIYRRWSDLQELLSNVAVEHFCAHTPPEDRGHSSADLEG
ncbi:hypothetical protein [Streptomyces erythrochromogenes]|uniref:hypothetical protein n=1 Tax=Streptomyces erythrochromogenes TaxID=285574 RepID=UPI003695A95F